MSDNQIGTNNSKQSIALLVQKARRNKLTTFTLIVFLFSLSLTQLLMILSVTTSWSIAASSLFLMVSLIIFVLSESYTNINADSIAEHINRVNPSFEESTQLLLADTKQLSPLQQLQLAKVKKIFDINFNDGCLARGLPQVKFRTASYLSLVVLILFFSQDRLEVLVDSLFDSLSQSQNLPERDKSALAVVDPKLLNQKIKVIAPHYTGGKESNTDDLNLSIVEGSSVEWLLEFSRADVDYYIVSAGTGNEGANRQKIIHSKNGKYSFKQTVFQTSIYRIVYQDKADFHPMPGVYSISVTSDKPPKIKIVQPNRSLVEIAKDGKSQFEIEALIKDDYGITEVKILASVAKGSGEAVKFRDKIFDFEGFTELENTRGYFKQWSLVDLGMEPGDEVYFSVIAKDNKPQYSQLTKSSTIIVRWLDNEEIEMAAEGIRISFVPEFFRSQRQIIIETEQLIEDKKDLALENFDELSSDLGYSQRDLKEKYGQYLGDEVGEGPGEQFGLADGYHGGEPSIAGEASAGMEEHHEGDEDKFTEEKPEIGHVHEEMVEKNDLSGKSELIAQFAHNHGTAEIGPVSKRDPKSWMKQAVNEMWQAELHLMLSEPEKALPYEYLAYKYLKLARAADRIYAKRLGFEPPPVSENKRLTGELEEISSRSLSVEDKLDTQSDNVLFQQAYQLLSSSDQQSRLTSIQIVLFNQLSERFLALSISRPVLIKYAATIERVLIEEKVDLVDCENCINELRQKLWQLLPEPLSLPKTKEQLLSMKSNELQKYLQEIKQLKSGKQDDLQGGQND